MPGRALRDELVTGALSIVDAPMRDAWVRDLLQRSPLPEAASALEQLCQETEQASPQAREVLMSVVRVVLGAEALALALRDAATERAYLALGRLLRWPTFRRASAGPAEGAIPDYGKGRPLTLGERKALARKPDRHAFDRLLRDPHPDVIRMLLVNPRLTEDDVVRVASRRPNQPEILAELARSPRWSVRGRVRLALVLNPGTPPEIAVPMVVLLVRHELQLVLELTEGQAPVRAAALELLRRRPPQLDEEPPDEGQLQ